MYNHRKSINGTVMEFLMSVDGEVLGAGLVAGGGGGAASALANTGNPFLIAIIVGAALIVILGVITRYAQRNRA